MWEGDTHTHPVHPCCGRYQIYHLVFEHVEMSMREIEREGGREKESSGTENVDMEGEESPY